MFTGRQKKIIELIAGNVQGIYGSTIASTLQVSSRTVRNEIQTINNLWKKECRILSSNQIGYYFDDKDIHFVRDFLYQESTQYHSQEDENRTISLLGMLIHKESWNIFDISEEMFLSTQSILREVQKLKRYLKKEYDVDAITVKADEVRFSLHENLLRKLLMRIMKDEVLKTDNTKIPCLKELLYEAYDQMEFTYITKMIEEYFQKKQVMLTDDCLIMVSSAIYISYVRNLTNHLIEESEPYEKDEAVAQLLDELRKADVVIMEHDEALLHNFLHIFKLNAFNEDEDEISDFSIRIFDEFCNEVMDKYNFDLRSSSFLYQNMLVHIEYMIRRLKGDYELLNPILKDVKKNYPFSYEISMLLVHIVYKYLNRYIQDDELSYIAIYIEHFVENVNQKLKVALVATPRKSVMNIIQSWLKNHFYNQIEIVEVIGQHALDEYVKKQDVEFIIALSDTIIHPKVPMYRISDFPGEIDQKQINSMIRKVRVSYRFKDILEKIFHPELLHIYEEETTFENVIDVTSKTLKAYGHIEDEKAFYDDILLREVNYPTFLNERFMIPHPLATFAKRTAVAVAIIKQPIIMDTHHIQIIFTLAIERKQNDDINVLFHFFKQIAARKEAMEMLSRVHDAQELQQVLLQLSQML